MTAATFKTTFLPMSTMMYRTAYSLLGNPQDAEDAVQEAFIRLWQKRDRLPVEEDLAAYCQRLVRNLCIDTMRRGKLAEANMAAEDAQVADGQSPSQALEDKEEAALVENVIHTLPENQQRVVELHVMHDRSLSEKQPVVAEIVEQDTLQPTQQHVNEGMTQEPSKPNKAMKPHKVHKTQTESILAEAEPMQEEAEPLQEEAEPLQEEAETEQDYLPKEPDPYLLAAADAKDIRARGELVYQEVVQIMNNP